jgi:redox-sensitive bicupin YhaK (pirin superfamily)
MIRVIKSEDRHHQNIGWLDYRWHFSFGDYYDPKNLHFSALRVFNDDRIAGGGGFDMHPHRDMEIVTVMLEGKLRHKDQLGNNELLQPNEVQVMSAGRGIVHGEFNASDSETAHLMQLWILPRTKNGEPRWDQRGFDPADRVGKLQPLVSDGSLPDTLTIDQDAVIYRSTLPAGQSVTHDSATRKVYLFVITGDVTVNGTALATGDQGRIEQEGDLKITAGQDAQILLIDLP